MTEYQQLGSRHQQRGPSESGSGRTHGIARITRGIEGSGSELHIEGKGALLECCWNEVVFRVDCRWLWAATRRCFQRSITRVPAPNVPLEELRPPCPLRTPQNILSTASNVHVGTFSPANHVLLWLARRGMTARLAPDRFRVQLVSRAVRTEQFKLGLLMFLRSISTCSRLLS